MRTCKECGASVPNGASSCHECGSDRLKLAVTHELMDANRRRLDHPIVADMILVSTTGTLQTPTYIDGRRIQELTTPVDEYIRGLERYNERYLQKYLERQK